MNKKHVFEFKKADANKAKCQRFSKAGLMNHWVVSGKSRFYVDMYIINEIGGRDSSDTFGYVSEFYFDFSGDKKEIIVVSNKEDYQGDLALDFAKAFTAYCESKGVR